MTRVALAGCSALPTAPNAPLKKVSAPSILTTGDIVPHPITNTVNKTVSLFTSKLIDGRVGGVVSVGHWKVVVPKGAYLGLGLLAWLVIRKLYLPEIAPGRIVLLHRLPAGRLFATLPKRLLRHLHRSRSAPRIRRHKRKL